MSEQTADGAPQTPTRVCAADLPTPSRVGVLEAERDANRIEGAYAKSARLQNELEAIKQEEDERHLQLLLDKHRVESEGLARAQAQEMSSFTARQDEALAALRRQAMEQEADMQERHAREGEAFRAAAAVSMPRPKYSSALLNERKREEHLARQKEFVQAAKVKALADQMEAQELVAHEEAYWAKVSLDESKLMQKQARELDAQRSRSTAVRDEAVVQQRRELDKLVKKFQVAQIELSKAQGMERTDLDLALVGYYNPRKGGLAPSPLVPASPLTVSLMTPALKLSLHQSRADASPSPSRGGPRSGTASPKDRVSKQNSKADVTASSAADSPNSPSKFGGSAVVVPSYSVAGGDEAASPASSPKPGSSSGGSIPSALQPKTSGPSLYIGSSPYLSSASRQSSGALASGRASPAGVLAAPLSPKSPSPAGKRGSVPTPMSPKSPMRPTAA